MHCLSCIAHVEGSLTDLPGVLEASANLSTASVQVRYIPEHISITQMVEAIHRVGYTAAAIPQIGEVDGHQQRASAGRGSLLYWLSRNWMAVFSLAFGFFVILPILAPVFMAIGLEFPARIIYNIFSLLCHQFPQRSFFLYGREIMYPLSEIMETIGNDSVNLVALRQFYGSPEMGWKVAWSDRMVSMFTSILIFAWVWYPLRKVIGRLSWQGLVMLLLPMAADGFTHFISDFSGIGQGFRDSNAWLAILTDHSFPVTFYSGDALGSFNSLARLLSGLLFGLGMVWFGFPHLDELFSDIKNHIQAST